MPRRLVTSDGKLVRFKQFDLAPLKESEVRVRVQFAAPKPGTETHVARGSVFDRKQWNSELRLFLPRTETQTEAAPGEHSVGNIVVGEVTQIGAAVETLKIGDRVFGYGPICDFHQQDASGWQLLGQLTPEDAVCTDPAHVAFVAVRDGNVRLGDDVAVFGLGAIGLLTVQMARASGAQRVFASDPFAMRREAALALRATAAFDPMNCDVGLEIKRATGNAGVDVSLETSGNGRALHEAIRCLRQCGTVVHVPWGPKDASALQLDEEFHLNRPTLVGSQAVWGNADRSHPLWNENRARTASADLFRNRVVTSRGIVAPIVPFEQASDAITLAFAQPETSIKIGVLFSEKIL